MATQDWRKAVIMDEMFDVSLTERIFWASEIVSIYPKAGRENEIYTTLKQKLPPTVKIYRKDELPARFHYTSSPRIPPLLVLPDEGLMVTNRERYERMTKDGQLNHPRGGHGYDNRLVSVRATFIGHGAAFKRGRILPPVANIHVYNLMAKILRLRPAPNSGDMRLARLALR